jgi:hypothetical protein
LNPRVPRDTGLATPRHAWLGYLNRDNLASLRHSQHEQSSCSMNVTLLYGVSMVLMIVVLKKPGGGHSLQIHRFQSGNHERERNCRITEHLRLRGIHRFLSPTDSFFKGATGKTTPVWGICRILDGIRMTPTVVIMD